MFHKSRNRTKHEIPSHTVHRRRFVKFILAGLLNTAFGYSIFVVFILLGTGPQIALILQFCIGVIWNYFTHARLVFEHIGYKQLPLYCVCYAAIYGFNALSLNILTTGGVSPLVAQAILTPVIAVISYLLISRALHSAGEDQVNDV